MNKRNANVEKVGKRAVLEEMLAMIRVCFEGEAVIYDGEVRMTLPGGESFTVSVAEVA